MYSSCVISLVLITRDGKLFRIDFGPRRRVTLSRMSSLLFRLTQAKEMAIPVSSTHISSLWLRSSDARPII